MVWCIPLPCKLIESSDSDSFRRIPKGYTALPLAPHVGSFGHIRREHVHEGVDLYCNEGTPVYAVEDGKIVKRLPFTGPKVGSRWWLDTEALLVEGESGVVVYGEILPFDFPEGTFVHAGDMLGTVVVVLAVDKGRPRSMLHVELHAAGTRDVYDWVLRKGSFVEETRPPSLRDPTDFLRNAVPFAL